jgi:hypothetical protein
MPTAWIHAGLPSLEPLCDGIQHEQGGCHQYEHDENEGEEIAFQFNG